MLTFFFFFFNDTATTEIYPLSLHDALPISKDNLEQLTWVHSLEWGYYKHPPLPTGCFRCRSICSRSEEHTSELQSPCNLVCRLLLEKKKIKPWSTGM